MNVSFFAKDISSGALLTRLRIKRQEPKYRSRIRAYTRLVSFAPVPLTWVQTPETEDGWQHLDAAGLSKSLLKDFWDFEEIELEVLGKNGEWTNAFVE
jgi:hypothetical protein